MTASMRRAVGIEVLNVDLLPREEVSAHWEAEERGRPSTSRLRMARITKMNKIVFCRIRGYGQRLAKFVH